MRAAGAIAAALLSPGFPAAQESAPASAPARVLPSALAAPPSRDDPVARVDGTEIRLSDLARTLLAQEPGGTRDMLRTLAVRELARREAERLGVTVLRADVEEGISAEIEALRRRLAQEGGGRRTLADYLHAELRTTEELWREAALRRAMADRFLGLVVRYAAMLEERVAIRVLTVAKREEAEALLAKVREGADFAVLARDRSIGVARAEGGRLPPFGRGWDHPLATAAFALTAGEVAGPIEERRGDGSVFHLVRLLERLPGRGAGFEEVEEEVRASLRARPVERFEYDRWVEEATRRSRVEFPLPGGP